MRVDVFFGLLLPLLARGSPLLAERAAVAGVFTSSGLIIGHPSVNKTGVTEYLGVPYAASPAGSKRFLPPQPFSSNTTFVASTYGP